MIDIQAYLQQHQTASQLLLQVHDELVFSVAPQEVLQLLPVIKLKMEQAADLSVKLKVEAKIGPNWGQMAEGV